MMSLSPPRVLNVTENKSTPQEVLSRQPKNSSLYPVGVADKSVGQQAYLLSSLIRQLCVFPENLLNT